MEMKTVKEIREHSGLSRAEFSRVYGIPVRTLEDWESGKRTSPPYMINLLRTIVIEDKEIDSLSCYDGNILREIGYCYTALLYVMNEKGHNPYPMAEIFPTKYFTMTYQQARAIGIPAELHDRIGQLLNCINSDQWATMMNVPVPMNKRQFFTLGELEYRGMVGKTNYEHRG